MCSRPPPSPSSKKKCFSSPRSSPSRSSPASKAATAVLSKLGWHDSGEGDVEQGRSGGGGWRSRPFALPAVLEEDVFVVEEEDATSKVAKARMGAYPSAEAPSRRRRYYSEVSSGGKHPVDHYLDSLGGEAYKVCDDDYVVKPVD